ncbi:hypothetical protein [Halomicrobium salinisoli]|uniref:hypothetical protein n=1 Tax=Halomicrobium salinisoli TaxID=2878391 RepID=UPI001CF0CE21|nr:hypothetical protein [Halomicrobium salinisoli]
MRAPGLDERMARVDGPNETARFLRATYDEDSAITFVQSSSPGPSAHPDAFQPDRSNATTVVADRANDTYYLLLDPLAADRGHWDDSDRTDGLAFESGNPHGWTIDKGYGLQVAIDGRTQTFRGDGDWNDHGPVIRFLKDDGPAEAFDGTFERDRLVLDRSTRAPITVNTSLSRDTTVTVRITNRSDGGPPVSDMRTVEWGDGTSRDGHDWNGVVTANLDTTSLSPGTTFDVELRLGEYTVTRTSGVISASTSTPTATPTARPTPTVPAAAGSATTTGASTPSPADSPATTSGSGPGFGSLAALVALTAAALVSACRRR